MANSRQRILEESQARFKEKQAEEARFKAWLKEQGYDIAELAGSGQWGQWKVADWREEYETEKAQASDAEASLTTGLSDFGIDDSGNLIGGGSVEGIGALPFESEADILSEKGDRNVASDWAKIQTGKPPAVSKVGDKPPSPAVAAAAVKTAKGKSAPKPLGPNESYDASRTDKDGNVTKGVLIGGRSGKMLYSFDPKDISANDKAKAQYKSDMENGVNYGRSSPRAQIIDKSQYQDERSRQYAELYKNGSKEQQRQRKQKSDNAATSARNIAATKKFYADEAAKSKITNAMSAGVAPPKADLDAAGMTEEDYKNSVAFDKAVQSRQVKDTATNFASRRNRDKRTRRRR